MKIIRNTEKKEMLTKSLKKFIEKVHSVVFLLISRFYSYAYRTGLLETVISLFFNMLFLQKVSRRNCQAQRNL